MSGCIFGFAGKRKIKWRSQVARKEFWCVRLVIVPPASYSSILCLKKKMKTNILIPIEFLMEQFPVRSAAATKALK